jgi:hypothetical protein
VEECRIGLALLNPTQRLRGQGSVVGGNDGFLTPAVSEPGVSLTQKPHRAHVVRVERQAAFQERNRSIRVTVNHRQASQGPEKQRVHVLHARGSLQLDLGAVVLTQVKVGET